MRKRVLSKTVRACHGWKVQVRGLPGNTLWGPLLMMQPRPGVDIDRISKNYAYVHLTRSGARDLRDALDRILEPNHTRISVAKLPEKPRLRAFIRR